MMVQVRDSARQVDSNALGPILLGMARETLQQALGVEPQAPEAARATGAPARLLDLGACFVTLRIAGELRGCIGSLDARRPLADDLRDNAMAAAFRDPRFAPLSAGELHRVVIEVSLLSEPEPLAFDSQQDLLNALRPGIDGLILEHEGRRGTFLPAVWEQLPRRESFLLNLKRKAGLASDFWSPRIGVWRYTTRSWSEAEEG